jgi:TonB family protein
VLPTVLKRRYDEAKATFERGQYAQASAQFRDVVELLAIPEAAADAGQLSDLRMLAEGFLVVAEQKAKPEPAPAPAVAAARTDAPAPRATIGTASPAPPRPTTANAANGSSSGPSRTLSSVPASAPAAADRAGAATAASDGISLPVALDQTMPAWNPPAALKWRAYRGSMRIVIDEAGTVASADIVTSVNSTYDAALLQAARKWRYIPAKKDGQPILYEKTIEVALNPMR